MSKPLHLRAWTNARRRRLLDLWLTLLPPLVLVCAVSFLWFGLRAAPWTLLLCAAVLVVASFWSLRPLDRGWLIRHLDAALPTLEDSSDLLFADGTQLSLLAQLQQQRIQQRLAALPPASLRPAWPRRAKSTSLLLSIVLAAIVFLLSGLPFAVQPDQAPTTNPLPPPSSVPTRLGPIAVEINPPSYTGLPQRTETQLAFSVPAGSSLRWQLKLEPQPTAVSLQFHDGQQLALQADANGLFVGELNLIERGRLYRVRIEGVEPLADQGLQRIEVIPDRPPQIKVIEPERSLSERAAGQNQWALEFEVSDDHGLGAANLAITLAQGSGENQSVQQQRRRIALNGGSRTAQRLKQRLDLAQLGMAAGDDLIVRLEVSDQHSPRPQTTRSSSLILRWPAEVMGESTGMDGLVQKVLPAYFRSQRQIIIDTEALLVEQPKLSTDEFMVRSDTIGVDQRLLRLRYGQFMGEETEDPGAEHEEESGSASKPSAGFGALEGGSAIEAFGHTHDIAEAATLLDPETKELLRSALNEMWQAELHLRQAQPRTALPYEKRALEYIKRVQQASRIYLARVGMELPPIDPARRLTGDRSTLRPRTDRLVPATREDSPLPAAWVALAAGQLPDPALSTWLNAQQDRLPAALDLLASLDALTRDPGCDGCRRQLQARLWPLLPPVEAGSRWRVRADAAGQAYLDALDVEQAP